MVLGEFIDGRPFVSGVVAVHAVGGPGIAAPVRVRLRFLLDTGSDQTMLSPADAGPRLRLPLSAAPLLPDRVGGLGGLVRVHGVAGTLHLRFSILGADVWGAGIVTVDKPSGRVLLELSAVGRS
jgi:hypothetical protein